MVYRSSSPSPNSLQQKKTQSPSYRNCVGNELSHTSADETLYKDLPVDVALGPEGSREEFKNTKDQKLASYFFPSRGDARALVILVHGHGCR
jgi:hypothetical protein